MMGRVTILVWLGLASLALFACAPVEKQANSTGTGPKLGQKPGSEARRIVSLDYCADQFILALAPREAIAALSMGADDDYAYFRQAASGLKQIRPDLEAVLALKPDLVVRTWGGGPHLSARLEGFGIPVLTLNGADAGQNGDDLIAAAAEAMGRQEAGAALIASRQARREALVPGLGRALYITSSGASMGSGTLIHDAMERAGLTNIAAEDGAVGWRTIPLETLVTDPPERFVTGFFDTATTRADLWSLARHSVMRKALAGAARTDLPARWLACPVFGELDISETLATAAQAGGPHADTQRRGGS
jgi:iron complex transport system substrate-binding protein